MNPKLKSGTLDLILLAALSGEPLYGLEILREVNDRTDDAFQFKEGSLYPALHRLVKAKWVESHWQASDLGGAPRKYYHLTERGKKALGNKREEWNAFRRAVDSVVNSFDFGRV